MTNEEELIKEYDLITKDEKKQTEDLITNSNGHLYLFNGSGWQLVQTGLDKDQYIITDNWR